ncbi:MAG: CRTAC1 family protein, partial [Armatimonadaceae bacterium]
LDCDNDGWQDVFLVDAGQDFKLPRQESRSRLYRNKGDGNFEDITAESGLTIDGFATGACVGDIDNDADADLLVTGYGRTWLFRGLGGGKFLDVTARAGIPQNPGAWGMGAAFLDADRNGSLDIYIANYVRYNPDIPLCRTANVWHGCTPNQYKTQVNELYLNDGNGTFREAAAQLGATDPDGAGLGVVASDFDNDGWTDIFVANDGTPNGLLHNRKGKFVNIGQEAGVAFAEDGTMRAGMGTDAGDFDGDGLFDLSITNFQNEVTSVYRNEGAMMFAEVSNQSGVGSASLNHLKFGVAWLDIDGNGWVDLYQGNGHVHDNVSEFNDHDTFEQQDQIFVNLGKGRFREIPADRGAFPTIKSVTRAVSVGDFNNDGRPDILINSLNRPARLLENRTSRTGNWIGFSLKARKGSPLAIGARVELRCADLLQIREVRSGGGYLGQSDLRPLFQVPAGTDLKSAKVMVRWPSGRKQVVKIADWDRYQPLEEAP